MIDLLNQMAEAVNQYGWLTFLTLLFISAGIFYRKDIFFGLREAFSGSIKSVIYEDRIAKLESEQIEERINCDAKMYAIKKDYESKINALEIKMEAMQDLIMKQSIHIARIEEQLKASQATANKYYKKAGNSIKPNDGN